MLHKINYNAPALGIAEILNADVQERIDFSDLHLLLRSTGAGGRFFSLAQESASGRALLQAIDDIRSPHRLPIDTASDSNDEEIRQLAFQLIETVYYWLSIAKS